MTPLVKVGPDAPQNLRALAKGHRVRMVRADIKRRLRAGDITVADALAEPDCAGMRALELLHARPWWGPKRALSALRATGASELRKVGELSDRQRDILAKMDAGLSAVEEIA
jgi:hypothetical protein